VQVNFVLVGRRPLPRIVRLLLAAFFRASLRSDERWVRELKRGGFGSPAYFERCSKQAEADRVRIALLEA
jgi:hypothetical protein